MSDFREAAPGEAPYPPARYAWFVVGVLTLVYVFSFIDRQIINYLTPSIQEDFALTDTQVGWLKGAAFVLFYTFLGIPIGRMADRHSRRAIIAIGLALWSVMTASCGLAVGFASLFALRLGVGVGEATLGPSAYSMIADYFPPRRLATAMSVYSMGIYLGSGLAFILGAGVIGFCRKHPHLSWPIIGEVKAWQAAFFAVGLPGLAMTLALAAVQEPSRRGATRPASAAGGGEHAPLHEVLRYIKANWQTFVCHTSGFGLMAMAGYSSTGWMTEFFKRVHKWDPEDIGNYYGTIVLFSGAAGVFTAGWWADALAARGRRDSKMRVGMYSALAWLPWGIMFPLVHNGNVAMALVAPAAFFLAMPFGVAPAAIQEMMPVNMRGQASALYLFVINLIGLGAGPLIIGALNDHVFSKEAYPDNSGVRYSLLALTLVAQVGAGLILRVGLPRFVESLDRLKRWTEADS